MTGVKKSMEWDHRVYKALLRALAPMPPHVKSKVVQRVISYVEDYAKRLGAGKVEFEHLYNASKELLRDKDRYMLDALLEALRAEGFSVPE